jgi:hypothetical protein
MKIIIRHLILAAFIFGISFNTHATLLSISPCVITTANAYSECLITTPPPPAVIQADQNTDKLSAWDEVQNFELTEKLYVDSVFNSGDPIVGMDLGGTFLKAGTIVSSHYVEWDPSGTKRVEATITTDSEIFAFIFTDNNLFTSDEFLGLPGLDYNDFAFRGMEAGQDTIAYNGNSADINWSASNPGDWARMITAFSPGGISPVPVPAAVWLFGTALIGLVGFSKRKKAA